MLNYTDFKMVREIEQLVNHHGGWCSRRTQRLVCAELSIPIETFRTAHRATHSALFLTGVY